MTTSKASIKKAQEQSDAEFEAAGFIWADWNKLTYTWPGDFPTFTLAPGHLGAGAGLIANGPADIKVLFAYGTPPAEIAARLNDEIEAIMFHDAPIDNQPLVPEPNDWIDVDDFMAGKWVRS